MSQFTWDPVLGEFRGTPVKKDPEYCIVLKIYQHQKEKSYRGSRAGCTNTNILGQKKYGLNIQGEKVRLFENVSKESPLTYFFKLLKKIQVSEVGFKPRSTLAECPVST